MSPYAVDALVALANEIMEEAEFCFLMTSGEAGEINARLMQPYPPEAGLVVHFGASRDSRKARELQHNPRATVAYQLPVAGAYVTLLGRATVETGSALSRQYWRESFDAFWPDGPEANDYAILRFVPERVEIMHIGAGVAPEPFGLRPAVLVRENGAWQIVERYP
jgi:general stress protein 26